MKDGRILKVISRIHEMPPRYWFERYRPEREEWMYNAIEELLTATRKKKSSTFDQPTDGGTE